MQNIMFSTMCLTKSKFDNWCDSVADDNDLVFNLDIVESPQSILPQYYAEPENGKGCGRGVIKAAHSIKPVGIPMAVKKKMKELGYEDDQFASYDDNEILDSPNDPSDFEQALKEIENETKNYDCFEIELETDCINYNNYNSSFTYEIYEPDSPCDFETAIEELEAVNRHKNEFKYNSGVVDEIPNNIENNDIILDYYQDLDLSPKISPEVQNYFLEISKELDNLNTTYNIQHNNISQLSPTESSFNEYLTENESCFKLLHITDNSNDVDVPSNFATALKEALTSSESEYENLDVSERYENDANAVTSFVHSIRMLCNSNERCDQISSSNSICLSNIDESKYKNNITKNEKRSNYSNSSSNLGWEPAEGLYIQSSYIAGLHKNIVPPIFSVSSEEFPGLTRKDERLTSGKARQDSGSSSSEKEVAYNKPSTSRLKYSSLLKDDKERMADGAELFPEMVTRNKTPVPPQNMCDDAAYAQLLQDYYDYGLEVKINDSVESKSYLRGNVSSRRGNGVRRGRY